jgi:hypothetical protein
MMQRSVSLFSSYAKLPSGEKRLRINTARNRRRAAQRLLNPFLDLRGKGVIAEGNCYLSQREAISYVCTIKSKSKSKSKSKRTLKKCIHKGIYRYATAEEMKKEHERRAIHKCGSVSAPMKKQGINQPQPCFVKGVYYASIRDAERQTGIQTVSIRRSIERKQAGFAYVNSQGKKVFVNPSANKLPKLHYKRSRPVRAFGFVYQSVAASNRALDGFISPAAIQRRLNDSTNLECIYLDEGGFLPLVNYKGKLLKSYLQ